jgi:hypothetical protein
MTEMPNLCIVTNPGAFVDDGTGVNMDGHISLTG